MKVVTWYDQSSTRLWVAPSPPQRCSAQGHSRDAGGVVRDRSRGHRSRSPGASRECPPARRGRWMPPAISCASISLDTRSGGPWGALRQSPRTAKEFNPFLHRTPPWQQDPVGCGTFAPGPHQKGATPDLEAFLRGGTTRGPGLAGCGLRGRPRDPQRSPIAPGRDCSPPQSHSGLARGRRESLSGRQTQATRPWQEPRRPGIEPSIPARVSGSLREERSTSWEPRMDLRPPVPVWPRSPHDPVAGGSKEPTSSLHSSLGTVRGGLCTLEHDTLSDSSSEWQLPDHFRLPLPRGRWDQDCVVNRVPMREELDKIRFQDDDLLSRSTISNSASSSSLSGAGTRARSASPQTPPDSGRRRVEEA